MPVTEIIVVRHAHRHHWIVDTIDGTYRSAQDNRTGIATDPALTSHGIEQSHQVVASLDLILPHPPTIENLAIFSSPYYRCLETIAPTVRSLEERRWSGKVYVEHGFAEWFGTVDFKHPYPLDPLRLSKFFPFVNSVYRSRSPFQSTSETYDQLCDRTEIALRDSITEAERLSPMPEQSLTLVIVAHTAVVIMLGRILTNTWPEDHGAEDFQCYLAGISRYRRIHSDHGSGKSRTNLGPDWEVVMNSDCSHLRDGSEGGWHFGAKHVQDPRIVKGKLGERLITNNFTLE